MIEANEAKLKPWRAAIVDSAVQAQGEQEPMHGPVEVMVVFFFQRLASHIKKDGTVKDNAPHYKDTRPDLDKLIRSILDACTEAGVWIDDSQVVMLGASKEYRATPGAAVRIEEIPRPCRPDKAASADSAPHSIALNPASGGCRTLSRQ